MSADITVQPLRAGVSAVVKLKSSNPAVGQVESPLTIASGNNRVLSRFTPLSLGETVSYRSKYPTASARRRMQIAARYRQSVRMSVPNPRSTDMSMTRRSAIFGGAVAAAGFAQQPSADRYPNGRLVHPDNP